MFDVKYKPAENGKLKKSLRLHAATIRKLRFCSEFAALLQEAFPESVAACRDMRSSIAAVLSAASAQATDEHASDAPDEPTDLASDVEVDEATEAKLDEIAPRKSAG